MKKILKIFCCFLIISLFLSVPAFATQVADGVSTDEGVNRDTIFTRVWEFLTQYKAEFITLTGDIALIVYAIRIKAKNGKNNADINAALDTIKKETGLSLSNQNNVVNAINIMIESYNKLAEEYARFKEFYDKYSEAEQDRNRVTGMLATEIATVLEILSTVYVNNKNLPQGVKDLVTIKYANCLKAIGDDEALASVVNAIRSTLNTDSNTNDVVDMPSEV